MKILKTVFYIAVISFILNFAWENAHAPLFYGFTDYSSHLKMCFDATIGDIFLILSMYFLTSLLLWNFNWIESIKTKEFLIIFLLGLIISIIFEKYAIVTGRWAYNENMPIIPFLRIGLSPVLQLIVTPYLTFILIGQYLNTNKLGKS